MNVGLALFGLLGAVLLSVAAGLVVTRARPGQPVIARGPGYLKQSPLLATVLIVVAVVGCWICLKLSYDDTSFPWLMNVLIGGAVGLVSWCAATMPDGLLRLRHNRDVAAQ